MAANFEKRWFKPGHASFYRNPWNVNKLFPCSIVNFRALCESFKSWSGIMRKRITMNDRYSFDDYISFKRLTLEDTFVVKVSGAYMQDERSIFNELSAALQLPGSFTGNWDAFALCLLDMNWIRQSNYLIAISHFDKICCDSGYDFTAIQKIKSLFSASLIQGVEKWQGKMSVCLHDDGGVYQLLPDEDVQ